MLLLVVDVERVLQCDDCSYDDEGQLIHVCGPCEEEAIRRRISWWQEGKIIERSWRVLSSWRRKKK